MKPDSMDAVFTALAHPARRRMLDILIGMPGCSVNDVAKYFPMSRVAVMKHLRILRDADLVISQKHGRPTLKQRLMLAMLKADRRRRTSRPSAWIGLGRRNRLGEAAAPV